MLLRHHDITELLKYSRTSGSVASRSEKWGSRLGIWDETPFSHQKQPPGVGPLLWTKQKEQCIQSSEIKHNSRTNS